MTLRVRRYGVADAGALALIFYRAVRIGTENVYTPAQRQDWAPEVWTAAAYAAHLAPRETWVACRDADPVGFLSVEDGTHIDLLFVDPDHMRQGVALVIYHAMRATRATARLTVEASPHSRAFFLRQGWRETGRQLRGTGDAAVVNTLMTLDPGLGMAR